jgi:uncharacterized membrane protein
MKRRRFLEWARGGLVFIPGVLTMFGVGLSVAAVHADDWLSTTLTGGDLFRGGIESARTMMTAIAAAAITLTALVFSITMLVLQLASSQFSPRVLRTFLRDVNSQVTLGIFVGTFAYALLSLRALEETSEGNAPDVVMTVAILLALVTVGAFVQYIDHIAKQIQVESIVKRIADGTHKSIDRRYSYTERTGSTLESLPKIVNRIVLANGSGMVQAVDEQRLVAIATKCEAFIHFERRVGDFVPRGAPLLHIVGACDSADKTVLDHIQLGRERTLSEDPAFGFRQLVDIGARALSPSMNDATTAAQVIDELHDLLRDLATRELGDRIHCDDAGAPRLRVRDWEWAEFVDLAFDELWAYGSDHIQVRERMSTMLDDLVAATAPDRRAILELKREHIRAPERCK